MTLGSLVDRLSIVNIKCFNVQDKINQWAKMEFEEFAEVPGREVHTAIQRLVALNLDRNSTMTQIDECLNNAVKEGGAAVDPRIKV